MHRKLLSNLPSLAFSLLIHVVVLVVLFLIPLAVSTANPDFSLESIFSEERELPEYMEQLEIDTKPTESLSFVDGGTPSTNLGSASSVAVAPATIAESNVVQQPTMRPTMPELALPSEDILTQELGEGEVTGEVGAVVEGYGEAMGRITQEIVRTMRQQKVTVVWLFDESQSQEDDRREIGENFFRVYDELGIAAEQDRTLRRGEDILLSMVCSYGEGLHEHLRQPSADVEQIKAAINQVPNDPTGKENLCQSVMAVLRKYGPAAKRLKRKLLLIVVTDESGDDGEHLEDAIMAAEDADSPVYVMGRESVFGYPYARQRWVHEETGLPFWLVIRRGPETAFPEALQWDGVQGRWDVQSAGFGPYEQVRMARESGGIFFVLPGDEENLVGEGANDQRKYQFLQLQQYQPLLMSRFDYAAARANSPFRDTLWNVISNLNPQANKLLFDTHDDQLNIKRHHYAMATPEFQAEAAVHVQRAVRAMGLVTQALQMMEEIEPLRASEASPRWRASYDLAYAQLRVFRIRLYQLLLTFDNHVNNPPTPGNAESNMWNIDFHQQTIIPDDVQFDRLKKAFGMTMSREEYLEMIRQDEEATRKLLQKVAFEHEGTPWARRAEQELAYGFGFNVHDIFWDPRYNTMREQIKVPSL